jgi:uncharacterized protein (TIGR02246 family)
LTKQFLCGSIVVPLLLVGCGRSSTSTRELASASAADRQQIQAAADRIWAAVTRTDAAAALAEYGDDAILLGPGAPMLQGKPAITKHITDLFGAISFRDVAGTVADITVSGDLGIETGTYSWTIVPSSGSPVRDKGKYIHVWARSSDGTWKVIRYVVNSDVAPR